MSDDQNSPEAPEPGEAKDLFYGGWIDKLFAGAQVGVVRSEAGREIPFEFANVVMAGSARKFDDLYVGMRVGFDVGWTSRGLRVTVISARE